MPYIHRTDIHNTNAAREVVPVLLKLFNPRTVIDIGCGTGTWLKVFEELGIEKFIGIDGDYVNKELLLISNEKYIAKNLEYSFSIDENFDLLLCLEVAEHLSESRAESFIKNLTNISDTIIFSAALPGQGGQGHLNEQFPGYWIKIFNKLNYEAFDILRPLFWNNSNVDWWYRQNLLVFRRNTCDSPLNQQEINTLIASELYKKTLDEICNLNDEIQRVESGGKRFWYYINGICRRFLKRFLC